MHPLFAYLLFLLALTVLGLALLGNLLFFVPLILLTTLLTEWTLRQIAVVHRRRKFMREVRALLEKETQS